MAQQTAVDFLIESIDARNLWTKELREEAKQAKEMEKQQIEQAYKMGDGVHDQVADELSEQYYTKTYGTRLQNETN
jgi:hypothetical protein